MAENTSKRVAVNLRLDVELLTELDAYAEANDRSRNSAAVYFIRRGLIAEGYEPTQES